MCFITTGQRAVAWTASGGFVGWWLRRLGMANSLPFFIFLFFIFITTLKSYDSQSETVMSNPCCFG